jgi:hypothetical protein
MATNRDILKEAIADAKSIKETAIANAKVALEEAFTPYLKEKLSAKLAEIDRTDDWDKPESDETPDEDSIHKTAMKRAKHSDKEVYNLLHSDDDDDDDDESYQTYEMKKSTDEMDLEELLRELDMEENMDETINDPKGPGAHGNIAPTAQNDTDLNEAKGEDEESEEDVEIDIENMSEEDLKNFIEGVIADMIEAGELEAGHEGIEDEEGAEEESEEEEISLDELLSEMGKKDNSGYIKKAKNQSMKDSHYKKMREEMDDMKKELDEAYKALKQVKSEINEVNLLNSKLLYANKVFKAKNLSESQKVKVLAAFDKASSKKEAQLVYETVMENLNSIKTTRTPMTESVRGMASKVISGTQNTTKQPIIEVNAAYDRMQKLAGIKK